MQTSTETATEMKTERSFKDLGHLVEEEKEKNGGDRRAAIEAVFRHLDDPEELMPWWKEVGRYILSEAYGEFRRKRSRDMRDREGAVPEQLQGDHTAHIDWQTFEIPDGEGGDVPLMHMTKSQLRNHLQKLEGIMQGLKRRVSAGYDVLEEMQEEETVLETVQRMPSLEEKVRRYAGITK